MTPDQGSVGGFEVCQLPTNFLRVAVVVYKIWGVVWMDNFSMELKKWRFGRWLFLSFHGWFVCRFQLLISKGQLGFLKVFRHFNLFEWMKLNRKKRRFEQLGPSRIKWRRLETTRVWTYWSLNMPMLAAEQIAGYCRMKQNKMFPCFPWVKIDTCCFNRRTCIWVRHFSLSDRSRSSYHWFLHTARNL